jgi:predicted metal-dependent peptidase
LLPLGFIMPSHFSESSGGFIIAADTSGSMEGVYPVLFGEVARICQLVRPEYVRLLWWDGVVQSEQYFTPDKYDDIGKLFKPVGGGGTTPACVTQYIREKQYKPKAVIWLTDGDFYAPPGSLDIPQLWGVVDNPRFVPTQGKVVHINSLYN